MFTGNLYMPNSLRGFEHEFRWDKLIRRFLSKTDTMTKVAWRPGWATPIKEKRTTRGAGGGGHRMAGPLESGILQNNGKKRKLARWFLQGLLAKLAPSWVLKSRYPTALLGDSAVTMRWLSRQEAFNAVTLTWESGESWHRALRNSRPFGREF